ncbi:MAG: queuosine precursor transporter [Spirochaetaceae bacterium]|nr:queuosine precursor transporter [Spirochaetaceae bacterium]
MNNEFLWIIMLVANFAIILTVYKTLGKLGLFIWIPIAVILANIQVVKLIELGGITATLGNIIYASSFLVTDILSENYGKKEAKKAVIIGFLAMVSMTLLMNLALVFKPAAFDESQSHLQAIFSLMPRITLASFAAYWLSQLHDVWAYRFWMKKKPGRRFIFLRNNMSTLVSQLIDSLVFTAIAFGGLLEWAIFWEIVITTYVLKVIVAILDTPLVYLANHWFTQSRIPQDSEV